MFRNLLCFCANGYTRQVYNINPCNIIIEISIFVAGNVRILFGAPFRIHLKFTSRGLIKTARAKLSIIITCTQYIVQAKDLNFQSSKTQIVMMMDDTTITFGKRSSATKSLHVAIYVEFTILLPME